MALLELGPAGISRAAARDADPDRDEAEQRMFIRSCLVQALGIFLASGIDHRGFIRGLEKQVYDRALRLLMEQRR